MNEKLCNAIILQAIDDYRGARKILNDMQQWDSQDKRYLAKKNIV